MQNVIFWMLFQFSLTVPCVELFSCFDSHCYLGVNCLDACCVSPVMLPFRLVSVSDPTRLRTVKKGEKETEILHGVVCR